MGRRRRELGERARREPQLEACPVQCKMAFSGAGEESNIGAELAADEGIKVRTVRVWDDVAGAPPERITDRRGIAGRARVAACESPYRQIRKGTRLRVPNRPFL